MASQKRSHSKHLCGRRVHVETSMVRVSVIRVRGGSGDTSVIVRLNISPALASKE